MFKKLIQLGTLIKVDGFYENQPIFNQTFYVLRCVISKKQVLYDISFLLGDSLNLGTKLWVPIKPISYIGEYLNIKSLSYLIIRNS